MCRLLPGSTVPENAVIWFWRLFPNADRLLDVEDLMEENDEIRNLYSQMEQKVEETQKAEKSAGRECRGSKKKTSRGEER